MSSRGRSRSHALLFMLTVVLGLSLHALPAQAIVPATIPIPAAATCSGSSTGAAVATVQGSKVGLPAISILLVTSCVQAGVPKLFFIDASVSPPAVVKTLNTFVPSPGVTPSAGWSSLTWRGDRGDLLACASNGESTPELYAIDISVFTTTADGTATKLRNSPSSNATCAGVAWDISDKTIFQTSTQETEPAPPTEPTGLILHFPETGTGSLPSIDSGCPSALKGLTLAGSTLFVTCDSFATGPIINQLPGTSPEVMKAVYREDEKESPFVRVQALAPPAILEINKVTGARTRVIPLTGAPNDIECDWVSFGGDFTDVIWVKDGSSLKPVSMPFGACSLGKAPALCGVDDPDTVPDESRPDTDGDGLLDCWETNGITVDGATFPLCADSNGNNQIDAGECADPTIRDVFVEIDYMQGHQPDQAAIQQVVQAFANAPVGPGGGVAGIRLHVLVNEQLPHSDLIALVPCSAAPGPNDANYDTLKSQFFGTATERLDPRLITAKKFAFRYGIFAHSLAGAGTTSGCAEVPGNDFVITLGGWTRINNHGVGTTDQQAGTFMHELGHTLGLRHGGLDNANCKPNYMSVMSYTRQFGGSPILNRPLDYSRDELPSLFEGRLLELLGVGGFPGLTAFGPPVLLRPTIVDATGAISWNKDLDTLDTVSRDINNLGISGCPTSPGETLLGWNDWANLQFNFVASADFSDGAHASVDETLGEGTLEMTFEQFAKFQNIKVKPTDNSDIPRVGRSESVAVAVFGSPGFNATALDPSTMILSAVSPTGFTWSRPVEKFGTKFSCDKKDLNRDGHLELICKFFMKEGGVLPSAASGLNQVTLDATGPNGAFQSYAVINIVP